MSNWTHVAGIVRLDAVRCLRSHDDPLFDKMFGKECLYNSPSDVWRDYEDHPDDYLPMGSEGSLHKSVWINPDKGEMAAYTVSIFGDLRDHDSTAEIIEWFKEKCKSVLKYDCWIRNAVITAENEWGGTETWTYKEK